MKKRLVYNEEGEIDRYVVRNRKQFMTPFELRAESLGILREKAHHRLREPGGERCRWALGWLDEYAAATDAAIEAVIGNDLESFLAFQQGITARIAAAFASGQLVPLRCAACKRIAFTPQTRQCIWCGCDWHRA